MLKKKLQKYLLIQWNKVKGCTVEEIDVLEKKYNIQFPLFYKEFLLNMGKHSGNFLEEYTYNYDSLLDDLHTDSKNVLLANNIDIPNNAFFFLDYSGNQFACFLNEKNNDNPCVRFYYQDNGYKYFETKSLYEFYLDTIHFYRNDVTMEELLKE